MDGDFEKSLTTQEIDKAIMMYLADDGRWSDEEINCYCEQRGIIKKDGKEGDS